MANAYLALVSPVADAGVAHFLDTASAYTSGKLQSWRANESEKAYVDFEGSFTGKNVTISATDKLYLDGGGNTYFHEVSADKVDLVVGGQTILEIAEGGGGASDYVAVQALNKFYLDGGGDTYIHEAGSNYVEMVAGGVALCRFHASSLEMQGTLPIAIQPTGKLYLDGGSNTYIHESGADTIKLFTGGTAGITLNSSQDVTIAGDLTVTGDIVVSGTGPNAYGGGVITYVGHHFAGAFTSSGASTTGTSLLLNTVLTGAAGDTGSLVVMRLAAAITTQTATESIGYIAQLAVEKPAITDALTGDITVAASVYIKDAPSAGETNAALYVASGASFLNLPTSDPGVAGQLWANSAVVTVSAG